MRTLITRNSSLQTSIRVIFCLYYVCILGICIYKFYMRFVFIKNYVPRILLLRWFLWKLTPWGAITSHYSTLLWIVEKSAHSKGLCFTLVEIYIHIGHFHRLWLRHFWIGFYLTLIDNSLQMKSAVKAKPSTFWNSEFQARLLWCLSNFSRAQTQKLFYGVTQFLFFSILLYLYVCCPFLYKRPFYL